MKLPDRPAAGENRACRKPPRHLAPLQENDKRIETGRRKATNECENAPTKTDKRIRPPHARPAPPPVFRPFRPFRRAAPPARAYAALESSRRPVERIAFDVGYGDPSAFRKLFHRITGLSPADYRRRFGLSA